MAKERKIRKHTFSDKHPIITSILWILIGLTVTSIVAVIIDATIGVFVADYYWHKGFVGTIVCSLAILGIYKLWFSGEFEGNLKGGNPAVALKPSIVFVVLWVYAIVSCLITGDFALPGIGSIGIALAAGISEEILIRGVPLSLMMRKRRDSKWIVKILIITSVAFGLIHAMNVLAGADPILTLSQVVATTGIGLLLGAIYLRSGNLLTVIIIHSLHDIVAFCNLSIQESGGIMVQDGAITAFQIAELLVPYIVMGVVGLWLVRSEKTPEIQAVWDKKWKIDNDAQLDSDEQ